MKRRLIAVAIMAASIWAAGAPGASAEMTIECKPSGNTGLYGCQVIHEDGTKEYFIA